jgi:hypothetical protein
MNDSETNANDKRSAGEEAGAPASLGAPPPEGGASWGRLNWLALAAGVVLLLAGFFLLSKADAWAENAAAAISPFCILGGFTLLFISLIVRPPSTQ